MLKIKLLLGLFIASLLLVSCDIKNPTEGLEVRIQTIKRTTGINVELLDAATKQPIETSIKLAFTGSNSDKIISSSNEPITEINTRSGIAVFALEDDVIPTESSPVLLNLALSGEDIVNNTKQIKVKKAGISNYYVLLSTKSAPPAGVATQSDNVGQSNGSSGTTSDATISTSDGNDNNSDGEAELSIPAGTVMQDSDGNNLSGSVEATISYTNPTQTEAMQTLDLSTSTGQLLPAAAVTINLSVGGQEVSNISGADIKLSVTIPETAFNPATGASYKEGEEIGQWVYNSDTNVWEWIKNLIINKNVNTGRNYVEITVSSLALAKINYDPGLDPAPLVPPMICAPEPPPLPENDYINSGYLELNCSEEGYTGSVYLEVIDNFYSTGENLNRHPKLKQLNGIKAADGDVLDIDFYRGGMPIKMAADYFTINVYDKPLTNSNKSLLGSIQYQGLSSSGQIIPLNFNPPANIQDVEISVYVKCDSQADNPRVISPDGFSLWAMQVNSDGSQSLSDWQSIGGFTEGKLTASLEIGAYYVFRTEYDGEMYFSLDYETPFQASEGGISYSIVDDNRVCDDF